MADRKLNRTVPSQKRDQRQIKKPRSCSTSSVYEIETYYEKQFLDGMSIECITAFLQKAVTEEFCFSLIDLAKYVGAKLKDSLDPDTIGTDIIKHVLGDSITCETRKEVSHFKYLKLLHVSPSIKPDVTVVEENGISPVLFAEIVSNQDFPATIRKLCLVLLTQLLYLRNTDITKTNVQGFSLSVNRNNREDISGGVVIATVKWHSSKLEYSAEFQRVTMKDFARKLKEIYELQKSYFLNTIDCSEFHCFPMGVNEISDVIGHDLEIILSAHSVIVCNACNVWKLPLVTTDTLHIFFLAVKNAHQILLPISPNAKKFYCFDKLQGPVELAVCKRILRDFATSVYKAIEEIHGFGFAHLDITLSNICFKKNQGKCEAVLIDMDTVAISNKKPKIGNRFILDYNLTGEENDWRQYAVLIECIHKQVDLDEDYLPEFAMELAFLKASFEKGQKPPLKDIKCLPGYELLSDILN